MCGIIGSIGFIPTEENLNKALFSLRHRGPDDSHYVIIEDAIACLGAVRLAFLDIEGGQQPVLCGDGRVIVTLNGEVFNYIELAKLLEGKGCILRTHCDTELIGYLYIEYGMQAFKMLRGMFAIALFDKQDSKVLLVCDFLAQKPIYYVHNNETFVFASEQGCLPILAAERISDAALIEGISDVLLYKAEMHINEEFRAMCRVAPGEVVEIDTNNLIVTKQRYLSYSKWTQKGKQVDSSEIVINRIESLLLDSIRARIDPSKAQVAFLSGGLDSSLIVTLMRQLYPSLKMHTFTLCYADDTLEMKSLDRTLAREVAGMVGSEHHEVIIDPRDLYYDLPEITSCFGTSFSSVPSMWYLTREMCKFARYTISGDGADELFGSYFTHRDAGPANVMNEHDAIRNYFHYMISFWPNDLLDEKFLRTNANMLIHSKHLLSITDIYNPVKIQLVTEALSVFPSTVLTYIDRLSMTHSLEPRCPFLDRDLWNYVMSLPDQYRIYNGVTKYALKIVAERFLPSHLVHRKKEGFVFPISRYLIAHKEKVIDAISQTPSEYFDNILKIPIVEALSLLYLLLEADTAESFKAGQILHSLHCICIKLQMHRSL